MSEIVFEPTIKQAEFLSSDADELLYGGAAGSGKSFALLIDCLGLNQYVPAITLPHYTALIIRKTYKELADLIRTSLTLYPKIDPKAVFNISKNTWTFNSGAQVIFGNCENDNSVYQYQGFNLQYTGIEELGQFDTDFVYHYLKSRLRTHDKNLKCYMRATANPSKYAWIKDYFGINSIGDSNTRYDTYTTTNGIEKKRKIQFISARLVDNPYLYKSGEYESMLQSLPEEERNALLFGRWDAYSTKGAIYSDHIEKARKEHRICGLPFEDGLDVYCFFDLGINDATAITVAQYVGKEVHIIDHIENTGKEIGYYFSWIKEKYKNPHIILPHDAKARSLQTGNTIEDLANIVFSNVEVLPKEGIEIGITAAREMFKNLYIEKTLLRLLECLENYRRKLDTRTNLYTTPIHDEYSNTADSFRYLAMYKPVNNTIKIPQLRPRMNNMMPW